MYVVQTEALGLALRTKRAAAASQTGFGEGRGGVRDVTTAAAARALRNRKHNAAGDGRRRRSAHARVARLHPARHGGGGGGVPQAVLLQRPQPHRVLLAARSDRHPGRDARRHAPAEPQRQRVPLVDDRPPKLLGERRAPAPLHERLRTRNAPGRHVPRSRRPALARSQQQPTAGIRTTKSDCFWPNVPSAPILSVFPALTVHPELKSVHPGFPVAFIF